MWLLKSAKDRILRIDTPVQHVQPRVWYGTTYLLIRNIMVACFALLSGDWHGRSYFVKHLIHIVQEGPLSRIFSTASGPL
jgi:hypothetical protein